MVTFVNFGLERFLQVHYVVNLCGEVIINEVNQYNNTVNKKSEVKYKEPVQNTSFSMRAT